MMYLWVLVLKSEVGVIGLHVGSACCFGSSIGTLFNRDADVARQPAEVNVEV